MDVVEWSAKLNQEAGLSQNAKAYFGAGDDVKEAERFANAIGYAIATGDGPDGRLTFAANVANIVKNSSGKSTGISSENLAYKSLVPENSYTKTSAEYKNALDAYRTAIRKGDEARDKYMAVEKAMKAESKPKPESEWDDNDIFEDLIGHRPMIYTEKGKQLKAEYDKYFKERMDYSHEMSEAGDRLREIKQKEHDKQMESVHLGRPKDAASDNYEGFNTKTTGTSYYDYYLNGERMGGRIAEMSPKEYLQRCAYQIFDSATIESTIAALDENNVKKYAEQMKSGTKFDMPYLNFASSQQEGRHRAAAAMQLGLDKIPVLVVGEQFAKYDGGPGSGNWGHEGREGKVGGSAPGGGVHNRQTTESGDYTSFSKKKVALAKPHKAAAGEFENLPNKAKVIADIPDFGKVSFDYDAKSGWFYGSDGSQMTSIDLADAFNDNSDASVRVLIPREASTNYSKLKIAPSYPPSRLAEAKSFTDSIKADAELRDATGAIWKTLTDAQKQSLREYTGSSFYNINHSLRNGKGTTENASRATNITNAIAKSKTKEDMWLYRGVDFAALPNMFEIKPGVFSREKIGTLVGKSGKDDGFMSCGTTTSTGYGDGSEVSLKIFVPKGSEAMYAEPFSTFGANTESKNWNGESKQSTFSTEMETIIQRGSHFQCTKASYDSESKKYNLEIAIVSQEYDNLNW